VELDSKEGLAVSRNLNNTIFSTVTEEYIQQEMKPLLLNSIVHPDALDETQVSY
jgi:hypothetical protein